jgi:hypothetical protein
MYFLIMFRALIVLLALALCALSPGTNAASLSESSAYLTSQKKPKPASKQKKTNFAPGSSCSRAAIYGGDWGSSVRCGYDYPPWALGWDSFKRAQEKAERDKR